MDTQRLEKLKKLIEITKSNKFTPEKLKESLELLNDGLSKEEFTKSFKAITEQVLKTEIKAIEKVNKVLNELDIKNNTLSNALQSDLRAVVGKFGQSIDNALKEQENCLNFIRDKVRNLKNGKDGKDGVDGKDADEEKILNEIIKKLPDNKKYFEKIEAEIQELQKKIDTLKTKGGGGTSAIGVANTFKYIAHTEQPSGLIDGINKTYTVNNNIWWIAGFTINGEQIAELPNFTYSANTITFSEAIPAAYSGKDFEVKYIGT